MRTSLAGLLVLIATTAGAAPDPAPPRASWADWVGSYHGPLRWSGCSVAGARTATLAVTFVDGVASIDLAPARPGMRALTLVEDEGGGWSGRQADVAVALRRPRADTLALAIDLDSGCAVRGTLTRATTKVAACDRLLGWARIDATCTRQDRPSEQLATLLATTWKPSEGARCRARADTLERALIDVGCAPHPDPAIGVRAPDCIELAHAADRLQRCGRVLPAIEQRAVAVARAVASAAQTAERATLPYVEQQCRDTRAELVAIATRFGCP